MFTLLCELRRNEAVYNWGREIISTGCQRAVTFFPALSSCRPPSLFKGQGYQAQHERVSNIKILHAWEGFIKCAPKICFHWFDCWRMPRKKPFSNKQKKKQLQEKREKKRFQNQGMPLGCTVSNIHSILIYVLRYCQARCFSCDIFFLIWSVSL